MFNTIFLFLHRCAQGDVVTHTAWLNRSSILYAGEEKWSVDPRVSLVTLNQEEFTIKIENVDMTDEGQYVCAVQTSSRPRTTLVHILVQGKKQSLDNNVKLLKLLLQLLLLHTNILLKNDNNKKLEYISESVSIKLLFLW